MSHILFEEIDHVGLITISRPEKLNSLTKEMAEDLVSIMQRCNADDNIRVLVLTGAGDRAFSCGSDIVELDRYDSPWKFRNRIDYCDAIRAIDKPIIAAINGYAFGGGLELSLSCDIRIASTSASFAASEIKLGWIGGGGVSYWLTHAIGVSNASMMLFTGDAITSEKACQWGMVSEVVEGDELMKTVLKLAKTISSRAPIAAITGKSNIRAAFTMPLEMAVKYERDLQAICMATEDAAEGRTAFKDKRAPEFKNI